MKRHRCKGGHDWRERRRSPGTFACQGCGTLFPCRGVCEHIDCRDAKGDRRSPPGVIVIEWEVATP